MTSASFDERVSSSASGRTTRFGVSTTGFFTERPSLLINSTLGRWWVHRRVHLTGLARNLELSLFTYDPTAHSDVKDWYGEMWEAAEPFDLAEVLRRKVCRSSHCVPENAWEQYAEEFERQQEIREGFLELPEFSRDRN